LLINDFPQDRGNRSDAEAISSSARPACPQQPEYARP
jgi:hypothetical protein